jgi:hypothetical protein
MGRGEWSRVVSKAVFGRNLKAAMPSVQRVQPMEDGHRVPTYVGIDIIGP